MVFAPRFDSQIFKRGRKNVLENRKKIFVPPLVVLHPCSRAEEEIEISNVIIMRNINIHLPFRGTESTRKIMEGGEKKSD